VAPLGVVEIVMTPSPSLVLFDIDGTLVLTGRAGVRGMNTAFARLYGLERALDVVSIAGRTDRAIVTDVFAQLAVEPTDAEIGRLRDAYLEDLRTAIDGPSEHPKQVLPGVLRLLGVLEERPGVSFGLLTGNFQGGAEIKLGHFDLWRRFAFGAFGDRHTNRRDLVPEALGRAGSRGTGVAPGRVIVIGDTPRDIDCARAHGVRSVGVATGPYAIAELEAAGADVVVESLDDVDGLLRWMDSLS
jgi:phosphoglycolate phosphatase-like HAD superfamily hydrolase